MNDEAGESEGSVEGGEEGDVHEGRGGRGEGYWVYWAMGLYSSIIEVVG